MTPPTIADRRPEVVTRGVPAAGRAWIEAATSADHKVVAKLWMGTAMTFLAVGAVLFALTRLQLIVPDSTIMKPEIFNRILSATSVTTVVLFAVPFLIGLIGYIVPLQIGARGVRCLAYIQLSYWLYAAGAFMFYASFLYAVPETALSPLPPLSDEVFSPSHGVDAWIGGVGLATLGFVCFAISVRHAGEHARPDGLAPARRSSPGRLRRSPACSSSWAGDAGGARDAHGGPPLRRRVLRRRRGRRAAPLLAPELDLLHRLPHDPGDRRRRGDHGDRAASSRKPLFSHRASAGSILAIAVLGVLAWMQNMYAPIPDGFAFMAMAAAVGLLVPIGLLYFNWIATMWSGRSTGTFDLALGSAVLLAFGLAGQLGTSVIPLASSSRTPPPPSRTRSWWSSASPSRRSPRSTTGCPRSRPPGGGGPAKAASALILGGAITLRSRCSSRASGPASRRLPLLRGHRPLDAQPDRLGGAFLLVIGVLIELGNLAASYSGRPAGHDPWHGSTLEWFALSPPPPHNFDAVPDVRSPGRCATSARRSANARPRTCRRCPSSRPRRARRSRSATRPYPEIDGSRRASRRGAADLRSSAASSPQRSSPPSC